MRERVGRGCGEGGGERGRRGRKACRHSLHRQGRPEQGNNYACTPTTLASRERRGVVAGVGVGVGGYGILQFPWLSA